MNPRLVTADRILTGFSGDGTPSILEKAGLLIDGSRIAEIDEADVLRRAHPNIKEIGGRDRIAIPGLINAHHHVGLTPFQMGARDQPLELWFPERLAMRDVDPRLDTLYAAFEMIASGVTTVQHLHSRAPGDVDAVVSRADRIISAYTEIGMRASYSFALRDQNRMIYEADEVFVASLPSELQGPTAAYLGGFGLPLAEQIAVFHALRERWASEPLIGIQIAPSNLHWLSDAALESAASMAEETGAPMHMHLLETPYQAEYAKRRGGGSALEQVDRFGLINPQLTIGHCVWMTADDIALLSEKGGCLCHNCSSNLRLKSGTADLNAFLASGVPVALGIDEAGINDDRDMLQEMRLALTLHRPAGHSSPCPSANQILRMATEHGAATTPFGSSIGTLSEGGLADIVLLDWTAVTYPYQDPMMPITDVLVRRAKSNAVNTVIVGGELVFEGGRFTRVSKEEVQAEIAQLLNRPDTVEEANLRRLADDLIEPVRNFYGEWI